MKLEVAKILNENFPVLHWQLINRFECSSIGAAVWNGTRTDSAVEYWSGYRGRLRTAGCQRQALRRWNQNWWAPLKIMFSRRPNDDGIIRYRGRSTGAINDTVEGRSVTDWMADYKSEVNQYWRGRLTPISMARMPQRRRLWFLSWYLFYLAGKAILTLLHRA